MLLFYSMGIPIVSAILLCKNKNAVQTILHSARSLQHDTSTQKPAVQSPEEVQVRSRYGFLFLGFSEKFFFWESVVLFEKSILLFSSGACVRVCVFWETCECMFSLICLPVHSVSTITNSIPNCVIWHCFDSRVLGKRPCASNARVFARRHKQPTALLFPTLLGLACKSVHVNGCCSPFLVRGCADFQLTMHWFRFGTFATVCSLLTYFLVRSSC